MCIPYGGNIWRVSEVEGIGVKKKVRDQSTMHSIVVEKKEWPQTCVA